MDNWDDDETFWDGFMIALILSTIFFVVGYLIWRFLI